MSGSTVLTAACYQRSPNPQLVALLLEHGATADIMDTDLDMTPLSAAILRCETCQDCPEHYGNFKENQEDLPPHLQIVEMLLGKDIDVDIKDGEGKTPLFEAVKQGNKWLIKRLVDKGASPNILCKVIEETGAGFKKMENTPFTCACSEDYQKHATGSDAREIVKMLIASEKFDFDVNLKIARETKNSLAVRKLMGENINDSIQK